MADYGSEWDVVDETPFDASAFAPVQSTQRPAVGLSQLHQPSEWDVIDEHPIPGYQPSQNQSSALPKEYSFLDDAILAGKAIGSGAYSAVADVLPKTVAEVYRGGNMSLRPNDWASRTIDEQTADLKSRELPPEDANREVFGLIKAKDIQGGLSNLGYSAGSMAAGVGAGAVAGSALAPGPGTVAGGAAGLAAALGAGGAGFATGYRSAGDQFVEDIRKRVLALDPNMSEGKWDEIKQAISGDKALYSLWEAGPEAIGEALTMGIIKTPAGKLVKEIPFIKNGLARAAAGAAAKVGLGVPVELAGETATQMGQTATSEKYTGEKAQNFGEAVQDVGPQTVVMTLATLGLGGLANRYTPSNINAREATQAIRDLVGDNQHKMLNDAELATAEQAAGYLLKENPSIEARDSLQAIQAEREARTQQVQLPVAEEVQTPQQQAEAQAIQQQAQVGLGPLDVREEDAFAGQELPQAQQPAPGYVPTGESMDWMEEPIPAQSPVAHHIAQGGSFDLLSGKPVGYGLGTAVVPNLLTQEEQARADAIRQERETPPPALPQGQGFEMVGRPQDFSQAEAVAIETAGIPTIDENAPAAPLTAADSQALDQSQLKSEADLIRDYQAQALADAGARGNDLLKYVKGRLDAKSISRSFGTSVTQDLRGRLGNWAFSSGKSNGVAWDVLEQEAKSQGLLAQDESLIDVLSNVRTKSDRINRDASRGIINGQNEVDGYAGLRGYAGGMDQLDVPVNQGPTPEESGLQPVNSDGTMRADGEALYRKEDAVDAPPKFPKFPDREGETAGEHENILENYLKQINDWGTGIKAWSEKAPNVLQFGDGERQMQVVSKNTRKDESPWRITYFSKENGQWVPTGHSAYRTKLEAVKDAAAGRDYRPDVLFRKEDAATAGAPADKVEDAARQWREKGTESPYFKEWFGDSKVVDKDGKPLVVYHTSNSEITEFDRGKIGAKHGHAGDFGGGFYFSADKSYTNRFGDKTVSVYLSIQNPFIIYDGQNNNDINPNYRQFKSLLRRNGGEAASEYLRSLGFDGVFVHGAGGGTGVGSFREIVVFSPDQIKSAIGNRGTFSPDDASILKRQGQPNNGLVAESVREALASTPYSGAEVLNHPGELDDPRLFEQLRRTGNLGARGTYNPATGRAYVFANNHADLADALQTARDELHHQATFRWAEQQAQDNPKAGPAFKQLNAFMAQVRMVKRSAINEWLDANDYGELKNTNYGAAEWLTHAASKEAPKWHDRYVAAVVEFFRKLGKAVGFDFKMTEAEIRNWNRKVEGMIGQDVGLRGQNARTLEQRAYHGTPKRGIEQFDWENHQFTGEGAAAFGAGTYFTQTKKVAEDYRKRLNDPTSSPRRFFLGQEVQPGTPEYHAGTLLDRNGATLAGVRKEVRGWVDNAKPGENVDHYKNVLSVLDRAEKKGDFKRKASQGQLYEVDIPDADELMDWDKPLSEQPAGVLEKLKAALGDEYLGSDTGERLYKQLASGFLAERVGIERSPEAASQYLRSIGIPGHRYLDGMSRDKGDGSHNFVIYDDKNVDITGTFYRKATPQATKEEQLAQARERLARALKGTIIRPEDGIAADPAKLPMSKESATSWLQRQYQDYVDQYAPVLREAGKLSAEAKAHLQNLISFLRGGGGAVEVMLTGKGELFNYAASDPSKTIPGSKSLAAVLEPIKGDQQMAEAFDLILKGERQIALAKYRPEIARKDYLSDRKYWLDALKEAQNAQERKLIRGQLKAMKEAFVRQVKGIDAAYWTARIPEVEATLGPEKTAKVRQAMKDYRAFLGHAVLDRLAEAGVLSQEAYKKIKNAPEHEWYAPMQRQMDQIDQAQAQFVGHSDVIKRLKGSLRNTLPAVESAIAYVDRSVRLVAQNNVAKAFMAVREANPDLAQIIKEVKVDPARVSGDRYIRVIEDGKKRFYEAPKEFVQALNGITPQEATLFKQIMAIPAKALRFGATMSLEFPVRNFMRDQWSAMINSNYGYTPFAGALNGMAKIAFKDNIVAEWKAAGGDQSYFTSLDRAVKHVQAKELLGLQEKGLVRYFKNPKELAGAIADGLRSVSDFAEKSTRVGLYANARKKGATPGEASTESRMSTLDFGRMGLSGRAMNSIIAFWNANVQDVDILARNLRDKPGRTLAKIALGVTLPSVLLWAAQHDDDRYKSTPQWLKDTFWVIYPWWDKSAKVPLILPKPFLMGALFGSSIEHMLDYAVDKKRDGLKDAVRAIVTVGGPGFMPTLFGPFLEWKTNYSMFRGRPLESQADQKLPPSMRANTQTQEIYKKLGNLIDVSPIKLENTVRGYTGNLGLAITAAMSAGIKAVDGKARPTDVADRVTEWPGVKAVFGREPIGGNSQQVVDFYNNLERASQAEAGFKVLSASTDKAAARTFLAENRADIKTSDYLQKASRELADIRKTVAAIQKHPTMAPEMKRQRMDMLNRKMTELAGKANAVYEKKRAGK